MVISRSLEMLRLAPVQLILDILMQEYLVSIYNLFRGISTISNA